ncbi:nucleotidyltransferase domain-containing protein [Lapillicoccus sp.]|uniref:nucleotidyltransferase domain-containing protein n=1 Tax=Lapillicoccus sp. TaxID=1909287 RepID=UPI0025EE77C4|nr:nucleotidyltransferase domain-containing protein [Lapillicoccus sp.]
MMSQENAIADARRCVGEWFPDARAAWLGGSIVRGDATANSDLDIAVLLTGPPAPFRDTRRFASWPVELFVHTDASLAHYRATDLARRQPTLMRLIGESVVLVDVDGSGARLQEDCLRQVTAGPGATPQNEIDVLRYAVTNLVDDLSPDVDPRERTAVVTLLWSSAAELVLAAYGRWNGTGKGLVRELVQLDGHLSTAWATRLDTGLRSAVAGDVGDLVLVAAEVLDLVGGRLLEGYRVSGEGG